MGGGGNTLPEIGVEETDGFISDATFRLGSDLMTRNTTCRYPPRNVYLH